MPQPRDLTGSIYKSKKLKSVPPVQKPSVQKQYVPKPEIYTRNLKFSSFSFGVALMIVIAILAQFFLMGLFRWI